MTQLDSNKLLKFFYNNIIDYYDTEKIFNDLKHLKLHNDIHEFSIKHNYSIDNLTKEDDLKKYRMHKYKKILESFFNNNIVELNNNINNTFIKSNKENKINQESQKKEEFPEEKESPEKNQEEKESPEKNQEEEKSQKEVKSQEKNQEISQQIKKPIINNQAIPQQLFNVIKSENIDEKIPLTNKINEITDLTKLNSDLTKLNSDNHKPFNVLKSENIDEKLPLTNKKICN